MPLRSVGKLITVSSTEFPPAHNSLSQKRESLRRNHIYQTIFGHVEGLQHLFQFQLSQPAYVIFNVSRNGLRTKKMFENFRIREALVRRRISAFFEIL